MDYMDFMLCKKLSSFICMFVIRGRSAVTFESGQVSGILALKAALVMAAPMEPIRGDDIYVLGYGIINSDPLWFYVHLVTVSAL